jgi:SAM-dependent methyltransferase
MMSIAGSGGTSDRRHAPAHAIPRSESMPSKYPISSSRKLRAGSDSVAVSRRLSRRSSDARMSTPPIPSRPFYTEYAWAFDLLIDRPVQQECRTIAAWLAERGVPPGATLLDAGCGTGRYARELSRHGYVVHGIDRSPELVAQAVRSADSGARSASFAVGDILEGPLSRYDAILCRGVLNDFLGESTRASVFGIFSRASAEWSARS